jgi:hypothetical protein
VHVRTLRQGARVLLRHPCEEDEQEFIALSLSSRRFHAGWVAPAFSAEQFAAYLRRSRAHHFEALLVARRENHSLLGAISLSEIVRGNFQSAYLGYWIGAAPARQGLHARRARPGPSIMLSKPTACTVWKPTSSPPTRPRYGWWPAWDSAWKGCP